MVFTRIKILLAASALLMGAVLWRGSWQEGQLLRIDPSLLEQDAGLMRVARRRGEALYGPYCAGCHGLTGSGDRGRGIPDLTDEDWLYGTGSIGDIERVITYGIRSKLPKAWNLADMPAYGTSRPSVRDAHVAPLSPREIRDIVEFLLYREGRDRVPSDAVARGAALFAAGGGCYDCHAADAQGDAAIGAPNLADHVTLYGDGSVEALTESISYGRAGVCPGWIGKLGPAGIREVAAYVRSLAMARTE